MKKTLGLLFWLMTGLLLHAQKRDEIVIRDTRKISRLEIPRPVTDSLEKKFPDANTIQYYQTATAAAKNGWIIVSSNARAKWPNEQTIYYTAAFKLNDYQYYNLYNKKGELLKYKCEMKKGRSPYQVRQAVSKLSGTFPGYALTGNRCYKVVHMDSRNVYYEVTVQKDANIKYLYYSANGQLVKVKE